MFEHQRGAFFSKSFILSFLSEWRIEFALSSSRVPLFVYYSLSSAPPDAIEHVCYSCTTGHKSCVKYLPPVLYDTVLTSINIAVLILVLKYCPYLYSSFLASNAAVFRFYLSVNELFYGHCLCWWRLHLLSFLFLCLFDIVFHSPGGFLPHVWPPTPPPPHQHPSHHQHLPNLPYYCPHRHHGMGQTSLNNTKRHHHGCLGDDGGVVVFLVMGKRGWRYP